MKYIFSVHDAIISAADANPVFGSGITNIVLENAGTDLRKIAQNGTPMPLGPLNHVVCYLYLHLKETE